MYGYYGGYGYGGGPFGGMMAFFGSVMWLIMIVGVLLYAGTAYVYWQLGKRAGVEWAWVAWIPGGTTFVVAKMANWNHWALWPILLVAGILISWIPFIGMAYMAAAIFVLVQQGQVLEGYGKSYAWLVLNFVPVIGTIAFLLMLLQLAVSPATRYRAAGARSVFGSPMVRN